MRIIILALNIKVCSSNSEKQQKLTIVKYDLSFTQPKGNLIENGIIQYELLSLQF